MRPFAAKLVFWLYRSIISLDLLGSARVQLRATNHSEIVQDGDRSLVAANARFSPLRKLKPASTFELKRIKAFVKNPNVSNPSPRALRSE